MVVLAASICTRGGKAVLSRSFREIPRSRIEGLLAAFPTLADSGTQHTTVERDNVRYVYQPLDELYMVLITNKQSNILQDIDSLHIFAQVVGSVCKSLDEREIIRNAYELLSAFDEIVSLGYRENLTISQIKTFLEMESHEERIQEIISRNKELEATEERKRKAKQLELQRKELSRSGRGATARAPTYPTYTPPARTPSQTTYDSYEAEKNKSFAKPSTLKGKGMQLGKKSKTTGMLDKVRADLGASEEDSAPLITNSQAIRPTETAVTSKASSAIEKDSVHVVINEAISARFDKEGTLKAFGVKGDLQLRISDASLCKVALDISANTVAGAQFTTHPNVDKGQFARSKRIQLKDTSRSFPANTPVGVLRWNYTAKEDTIAPMTFNVWVNKGAEGTFNLTVEYEATGADDLHDVVVSIPFSTSEPTISSHDAIYEVSGDSIEWTIGTIDESNQNGSFEFEAEAEDEAEFYPLSVAFSKSKPFVEVDVTSISLIDLKQSVSFSRNVTSVADSYVIEVD